MAFSVDRHNPETSRQNLRKSVEMIVLIGIIAFVAITGSNGELCQTAWGSGGLCIDLKRCYLIVNIWSEHNRRTPPQDVDLFRRSQCGWNGDAPKVCCPIDGQVPGMNAGESSTRVPVLPDVTNHPNLRLLDNDNCGPAVQQKIFQGKRTFPLEFPWMASLGYEADGTTRIIHGCGGSVINKRYILTAAHCIPNLVTVRLGEHDFGTEKDCVYEKGEVVFCADRYQNFWVESTIIPPSGDIALIRLGADIDFRRNNVKPICLPIGEAVTLKAGKGIVTGWGLTENKAFSRTLLKVSLPIISKEDCARAHKDRIMNGHKTVISDNQICAGGVDGRDSCGGDSGGPLQYPDGSSGWLRYVQYGVVSFGAQSCGTPGVPGVYTNVAYYMGWILDTIRD